MASKLPNEPQGKKTVRVKMIKETKEQDEETAEAYMRKNYPDSCQFLSKWRKRYNWKPSWEKGELDRLLASLKIHDCDKGRNPTFGPGKQMRYAKLWSCEGAKIRGKKKQTQREGPPKKQTEAYAVAKPEDNDGTHVQTAYHEPNPEPYYGPQPDPPGPPNALPQMAQPNPRNPFNPPVPSLYPQLPVEPPPHYTEPVQTGGRKPVTRQTTGAVPRKNYEGGHVTPFHSPGPGMVQEYYYDPYSETGNTPHPDDRDTEAFPLIQLPNPRADAAHPTVTVYRTWTIHDVKAALEGLRPCTTDIEGCIEDFEGLVNSYLLNGREVQQALQTLIGHRWFTYRHLFDPNTAPADGGLVRTAAQNIVELNKIHGLWENLREKYRARPDWTKIHATQQGASEPFDRYEARAMEVLQKHSGIEDDGQDDGAFRQQLKAVVLLGMREPERDWLKKTVVTLNRMPYGEFCDHARHAERREQEKKKKQAAQVLVNEDGVETYVYEPRGREGGFRDKNRGKGKRRTECKTDGQKESDRKEGRCYICHKKGHLARDCKERDREDNRDRRDRDDHKERRRDNDRDRGDRRPKDRQRDDYDEDNDHYEA